MDDNVGKGSLSIAKHRSKENSPTHIGSLTIEREIAAGTKLWLAAWLNRGRDGSEYLSVKASLPQARGHDAPPSASSFGAGARSEIDDEIPF